MVSKAQRQKIMLKILNIIFFFTNDEQLFIFLWWGGFYNLLFLYQYFYIILISKHLLELLPRPDFRLNL